MEVFVNYENVTLEDKNDRVYEPMQNYYASLSKKTMQTGIIERKPCIVATQNHGFHNSYLQWIYSVVIFKIMS